MESYFHSFTQFIMRIFPGAEMRECTVTLLLLRIVERIKGVPPSCLVYTVVQVLRLRDKLPERSSVQYYDFAC
jgi:hypothetical protein